MTDAADWRDPAGGRDLTGGRDPAGRPDGPVGWLARPELVLCGLSMVPIAFTDLVRVAAGAGFDAVSVGAAVYRRAVKDRRSMADMRRILDDSGIWVSEVEGVGNWLTPPQDKPERWAQPVSDEELLDLAVALGARNVLVTHFGSPVPAADAAGRFAALCDQVSGDGLGVALEFVAFATIGDLPGALEIVEAADRDNGGLIFDTWHYFRGHLAPERLATLPAGRVFGVQLADADIELRGTLEEDILHRRLPGALDVAGALGQLDRAGVRAPIGIEVWDSDLLAGGPDAAAAALYRSVRRLLDGPG